MTALLGRDRYVRDADADAEDARAGLRNGYCPTTVKTTAGPVTLQRPKLRSTTERFASQLFGTGVVRSNALEALVIAGFVRGLSVREVEAALTIERTFGETRRRVKVIGRLPGEHSCLSLVWAVLDRASAGWRGFTMTATGLRLLQDLRRSLLDPPTQLRHRDQDAEAPPDSVGAVA